MKKPLFIGLCAIVFWLFGTNARGQCASVSINVSFSDSSSLQLYHPGFFLFGSTESDGGLENLCSWSISSTGGVLLHEAQTTGDFESQSFMSFEHTLSVNDTLVVELILSNPAEANDCCIQDTIVWLENPDPLFPFGNWVVLGEIGGSDCDTSTDIEAASRGKRFLLYPQPATDRLWIEGLDDVRHLQLYDFKGKLLAEHLVTQGKQSFDIQNLATGIYLVHLVAANGQTLGLQRMLKHSE